MNKASAQSVIHFFLQGGFFMVPLVICSVVSVAVMLMRGFALRRKNVMPPLIETEIEELQPSDNADSVAKLTRLVRHDPSALARIVLAGLQHLQWTKTENVEAVQTRARHEIVRLESGLVVLEIIVGIAPLLGLVGTIIGMMTLFNNIGAAGLSDAARLANGIGLILKTTLIGLLIAIPALIAWSYFSKKVEVLAVEMEALCDDFIRRQYGGEKN